MIRTSLSSLRSPRRFAGAALGLSLCGALLPPFVHARVHPAIHQSVWLKVTPEGQQLFADDLLSVIEGSGFPIQARQFDQIDYQAEEPVSLDGMTIETTADERSALEQIQTEIRKWLLGIELEVPRIHARILNLSYCSSFETLSLKILGTTPARDGIRVRLDLIVPQIEIRAAQALARDQNNEWLGELGIQDIQVALGGRSKPLKITGEFSIHLKSAGRFTLTTDSLHSNLSEIPADIDFSPEIQLPKIEVVINGRTLALNPTPILDLVRSQKHSLISALQKYLGAALRENLPKWFEVIAKPLQMTTVDKAIAIPAIGAPESLEASLAEYKLGLFAEGVGISPDGALHLVGASFVEDPISDEHLPAGPPLKLAATPRFDRTKAYDFSVGIHPELINRMLTLSHRRGYFEGIPLNDGSTIDLFEAPKVEIDGKVPAGMLRMKLALKTASGGGFKRLFVRKDVRLKFDGFVQGIRNADASFSLALRSVDLDSLEVDDKAATLGLFKGIVRNNVLEELRKFDTELRQTPLMLAAQVRPPENVMGLRWTLLDLTTEPRTGFISAYFGFKR